MAVSVELLSKSRLLSTLSPRTQRGIADKAVLQTYPEDADLYRQGDAPSPFYILQAGRVKLYRHSKEKRQILALPTAGDCLGAESLPTNTPSPYTATTLTQVTAIVLPPDVLQGLMDDYTDFQEAFLKMLTDRLKQFVTLVHDLAFRDVTSRLAMVLLARAESEGQRNQHGIIFERLLSQQEFADMVGTAREVVYRTFKSLEAAGFLEMTRHHIVIYDLAAIRAIALQEAR